MHDALADGDPEVARILESSPRGVSLVIGPTGDVISEVQADSEGILYTEINLADCVEPKQFHDVVGYYNRFDIFKLTVNRAANRPITFEGTPEPETNERLRDAADRGAAPPTAEDVLQ